MSNSLGRPVLKAWGEDNFNFTAEDNILKGNGSGILIPFTNSLPVGRIMFNSFNSSLKYGVHFVNTSYTAEELQTTKQDNENALAEFNAKNNYWGLLPRPTD